MRGLRCPSDARPAYSSGLHATPASGDFVACEGSTLHGREDERRQSSQHVEQLGQLRCIDGLEVANRKDPVMHEPRPALGQSVAVSALAP